MCAKTPQMRTCKNRALTALVSEIAQVMAGKLPLTISLSFEEHPSLGNITLPINPGLRKVFNASMGVIGQDIPRYPHWSGIIR